MSPGLTRVHNDVTFPLLQQRDSDYLVWSENPCGKRPNHGLEYRDKRNLASNPGGWLGLFWNIID